jgi:peptidoglycan/xylan/chitin deacetylase (PgdA/CDA1 family)
VLTYHAVVERPEDLDRWPAGARRYVFTADEFARHLDYLVAGKFETLALADLVRWLDGERELPERPVVLSFDDGHASNATRVTPALAERGQRGTFFITAGRIGRDESFVNWDQLLAMDEAGMEIGSHTLTHPFPSALKPQTLAHELRESKRILEDGLGTSVDYVSSPSGYDSRHFARLAREAGYRAALQGRLQPNERSTDRFALGRFVLKRAHDFELFVRLIEPGGRAWRPLRRRQMVRNAARAVLGPRGYEAVRSWLLGERSGDQSWP